MRHDATSTGALALRSIGLRSIGRRLLLAIALAVGILAAAGDGMAHAVHEPSIATAVHSGQPSGIVPLDRGEMPTSVGLAWGGAVGCPSAGVLEVIAFGGMIALLTRRTDRLSTVRRPSGIDLPPPSPPPIPGFRL
jgi:hypothetical protein